MNQAQPAALKRSRKTFVAIVLVSVLPMVAAWFVFFTGIGMPDAKVNAGQLLNSPIAIKQLLGDNSAAWSDISQRKVWRLLIPIGETCPQACQENLYTTRQVHIRLGEKSARVERVAINIAGAAGEQFLDSIKREHPRLKHINVPTEVWRAWLAESGQALDSNTTPFYLLMDQEGFVIMAYTAAQHGNELIKDLKRALKFSIDYQ